MKQINFTPTKYKKLQKAYKENKDKDSFTVILSEEDGPCEFVTSYCKYLLEYLDSRMELAGGLEDV